MARSEQRRIALRLCVTTLAWVACVFAWVSLLTFDVSDAPATAVWPPSHPSHNLCGPLGARLAFYLFKYLGTGTFALATLLTAATLAHSRGVRLGDAWLRFVGVALICAAVSTAATMFIPPSDRHLSTGPGGILGTAAAHFLRSKLETTGTLILLASGAAVGLLLAADDAVVRILRWLWWLGRRSTRAVAAREPGANPVMPARTNGARQGTARPVARPTAEPAAADEDELPSARPQQLTFEVARVNARDGGESEPAAAPPLVAVGSGPVEPSPQKLPPRATPEDGAAAPATSSAKVSRPPSPLFAHRAPESEYRLPGIDLLDEPTAIDKQSIEILCREKAYVLEQTLNEFRLEVQVVAIETGPVITVFELKLAPGIKVSQIASLANDMARALKAPAVRVVAPLPGKNTIGIEVPNIDKEKVRLKDVMLAAGHRTEAFAIPLYLGKDASGQPLVNDLTRMPHLLIAGTTGSGKSVCIGSLIMSVLMTRSPAEVNMILVDPKVVELAIFKDVPHLMCPIVTEVSKAEGILDWAATKMDERYALFAEAGVKDIRAYNRLGVDALRERFQPTDEQEMAAIPTHLPYIVIIIDELADLMMTSAKEVEFYLCRLAQKSRAVGIHLIVSTQRPQANVVTGLVKSNLPCRIAFRVASRLDSRIVLDQNGAEVLMGQGDMLFLPPGSSKLIRSQGTFVSDDELRRAVRHCREHSDQCFHPELARIPGNGGEGSGERDELFDQAVDIILDTGRGSVSLLQRRLGVGYSRASRIIDQMYAAGIVGEYKGSQAREVTMAPEEWNAAKSQRDREEAEEAAEVE